MVANRSRVSSLLSRNLPHPSKRSAMTSTFVPEKSSKHTLNMCRIRWGGTTRNFVRFDKYRMFYESKVNIKMRDYISADFHQPSVELQTVL